MKTYQGLTIEEARRLWAYDPETGVLTWRVNRGTHKVAGKVAGCKNTRLDGTCKMQVQYRGKTLMQSIVIWGVHTGAWPEYGEGVFCKDKDPINLKWENLVCDQASVVRGSDVARRDNTSGVRGVHWHRRAGKWMAQIRVDGKKYYLGLFKTIEEAAAARKAAEEKRNAGGFRSGVQS